MLKFPNIVTESICVIFEAPVMRAVKDVNEGAPYVDMFNERRLPIEVWHCHPPAACTDMHGTPSIIACKALPFLKEWAVTLVLHPESFSKVEVRRAQTWHAVHRFFLGWKEVLTTGPLDSYHGF